MAGEVVELLLICLCDQPTVIEINPYGLSDPCLMR